MGTSERLRKVAGALFEVADGWSQLDQRTWDTSATRVRDAFGMSLDEVAAEVLAFADEVGEHDPIGWVGEGAAEPAKLALPYAYEIGTGGNCTALQVDLPHGRYAMLTSVYGGETPDVGEAMAVGIYEAWTRAMPDAVALAREPFISEGYGCWTAATVAELETILRFWGWCRPASSPSTCDACHDAHVAEHHGQMLADPGDTVTRGRWADVDAPRVTIDGKRYTIAEARPILGIPEGACFGCYLGDCAPATHDACILAE